MSAEIQPARVLIVDDIEENLIALEALLRRLPGIELVQAHSGREALEILLVQDVALALLDVNMPEMDGFQLAELMRGSQRTKDVPIIFLTAAYDPQRVFQGYDVGAVDFLIKPVDPKILKHKVQTLIELYRSRAQLAVQSRRLAEALRMHETFVAAVNHDLRTPLHTISVGVSLLVGESPTPEVRDVARRVEAAIDRMGGMLDQLYDLARSRIGEGISLQAQAGDLAAVIGTVLQEAELRGQGVALELVVEGDARGTWDITRVSRSAANLIANALQHGVKGAPIRVAIDGRDPDWVSFSVANAGVIPADLLPSIFEPFRRGSTSSHKGLGLGLYIVREIATVHGGEVNVVSTAQVGTTFTVRLPRHVSE